LRNVSTLRCSLTWSELLDLVRKLVA
jgi:hypothetical protein